MAGIRTHSGDGKAGNQHGVMVNVAVGGLKRINEQLVVVGGKKDLIDPLKM